MNFSFFPHPLSISLSPKPVLVVVQTLCREWGGGKDIFTGERNGHFKILAELLLLLGKQQYRK
jgi:hypothetical protein